MILVLMLAFLAISAVGIYYLGDDSLAMWAALAHLCVGLTMVLPLVWHWRHGRQNRLQRVAPAHMVASNMKRRWRRGALLRFGRAG